jgi:hypothetical protein
MPAGEVVQSDAEQRDVEPGEIRSEPGVVEAGPAGGMPSGPMRRGVSGRHPVPTRTDDLPARTRPAAPDVVDRDDVRPVRHRVASILD